VLQFMSDEGSHFRLQPPNPVDVVYSKTFACELLVILLSMVLLLLVACSVWACYDVKHCTNLSLQQYNSLLFNDF
jgi:hypothetical protein